MATQTTATRASAPAGRPQAAATTPFIFGSRAASRLSFTVPTVTLGTNIQAQSPIQIPPVGYIRRIDLDVTITTTGGTAPAYTADGPFNVFSLIELRNSSGNDLIVPMDGYQWMLINKYGAQGFDSPACDPRANATYDTTITSTHFTLSIPMEIAPGDTFGAIPALAANRNYQLQLSMNALANVISGAPTSATVDVVATVHYWTEPAANANGQGQATIPPFNGTVNLWQFEGVSVTAGDKYFRSNNVGNVLRTLIFVARNSSGARVETSAWPAVCELYLNNDPLFYLPTRQWKSWMSRIYSLTSSSMDVAGGLDTGVFVIPFFALAEGKAIANARRSQYLPTLDSSSLQIRGTSWGASASTLEIITNSVQPRLATGGNPLAALYAMH